MQKTIHDSETKAEGLQVIVACAFVHHKFNGIEKVFLPKRASTKKFMPNVYELPGGHIDFGEDITEGLERELFEEFGKKIVLGDPFAVFTYSNEVKRSRSVEIVYFAQFKDGIDNIEIHPEDHSGYEWIGKADIAKILIEGKTEDDEEYRLIKRAFDLLEGSSLRF